ncbi:MAG TPA: four helix bundle protein [Gemmatimonadales bacterium]|nr:four helix bundle protein [Gemmatimonadales bacterium]
MPATRHSTPPHERLEAWRACHELLLVIYRATRKWEADGAHVLIPRVHDAALAAATALRQFPTASGPRDRGRLLSEAAGALGCLDCLLLVGRDLRIIDPEEGRLLDGFVTRATQLIGGLRRSWRRRGERAGAG